LLYQAYQLFFEDHTIMKKTIRMVQHYRIIDTQNMQCRDKLPLPNHIRPQGQFPRATAIRYQDNLYIYINSFCQDGKSTPTTEALIIRMGGKNQHTREG